MLLNELALKRGTIAYDLDKELKSTRLATERQGLINMETLNKQQQANIQNIMQQISASKTSQSLHNEEIIYKKLVNEYGKMGMNMGDSIYLRIASRLWINSAFRSVILWTLCLDLSLNN